MDSVDLFSGAGGFTIAAKSLGIRVRAAVNHWPKAVKTHHANHPDVLHFCEDACLLDPRELPPHNLLQAAPACQGHSPARGKDQPHHDVQRATAWTVVYCAEVCRPLRLVVENVPEMRAWALYPHWLGALQTLGYKTREQVLNAADFGVPQERERFFLTASLGSQTPPPVTQPKTARVPFRAILDTYATNWSPIRKPGRSAKTLAQIATARRTFGRGPFLIPYYGSGSGLTGRSLDRPLGTVTTRDRWAVVDGNHMRMVTPGEYKLAMGFPPSYQVLGNWRDQVIQLGNAICPPVGAAVLATLM